MERTFFILAAVFGFLGVGLGAFGAHGLRDRLEPRLLEVFEVGVRYQMYHALALIASAWAVTRFPGAWSQASGWCFVIGILIFSGSLYLMAMTGMRWLGAITPIGGLAFLLGWVALMIAAIRSS